MDLEDAVTERATHTPGEWTVHPSFPCLVVTANADSRIVGRTDVENYEGKIYEPENRANARLFAAAPQMLEALRLALTVPRPWLPGMPHVTAEEWMASVDKIVAAIAATEGK